MTTKNVLAIHDMSCIGKSSLTVALPILSAYGGECRALPTALLSTHTGGFSDFTFLDLTDEMRKILAAWQPLNLHFDAIYSGFMANVTQIDILKEIFGSYPALRVVDPVMADNGVLYSTFDEDYVKKMRELVPLSDIITPNVTEACLLTGILYQEQHDEIFINDLLAGLRVLGASKIALTSVHQADKIGVAAAEGSSVSYHWTKEIRGLYHGTGDIFASVLTAQLMADKSFDTAVIEAVKFVSRAILATPASADPRFGVNFEEVLANDK